MTIYRAYKVATWTVIGLMVASVAFCLFSVTGCRTVGEFFDGKATVNKTTILLAILVAAGVAGLVTGWIGIALGGGSGLATTWLSTTSSDDPGAFQPPQMPWYLDPWVFIRPILTWFGIAVGLGLIFNRSRQQTVRFLKDTLSGHPIVGARRFLAAMGWLHSDPISDKKE